MNIDLSYPLRPIYPSISIHPRNPYTPKFGNPYNIRMNIDLSYPCHPHNLCDPALGNL